MPPPLVRRSRKTIPESHRRSPWWKERGRERRSLPAENNARVNDSNLTLLLIFR